jgi:hypothetical protein
MTELLEAVASIAAYVLIIGLLGCALYYVFGPQVLGLPAIVGLLVVVAGVRVFSNTGLAGLGAVVVGLLILVMVIGMAMTLGTERSSHHQDEGSVDDP